MKKYTSFDGSDQWTLVKNKMREIRSVSEKFYDLLGDDVIEEVDNLVEKIEKPENIGYELQTIDLKLDKIINEMKNSIDYIHTLCYKLAD